MSARSTTRWSLGVPECAGIALLLHLMILFVLEWNIRGTVMTVPVRTISIRLGSDDTSQMQASVDTASLAAAAPAAGPMAMAPEPEPVKKEEPKVETIAPSDLEKMLSTPSVTPKPHAKTEPQSRQYLRNESDDTRKAIRVGGSELGNSSAEKAAAISRYEQLLSLWVLKHRVYPQSARDKGLAGEAMVRVRIDRHGNIRYSKLERSTGSEELDQAAREMIAASDPVPAVPAVYPGGEQIEFLIPVVFR